MYMVYGDKNVDLIFWILLGSYFFLVFEIIFDEELIWKCILFRYIMEKIN